MTMPVWIWAAPYRNSGQVLYSSGDWWENKGGGLGLVPYIRFDALAEVPKVQALIEDAVKAERERCAKVAEASCISDTAYAAKWPDERDRYEWCAHRAETIAAAIRSQP